MDTRICFRVRERKDVNLVLGQGMLNAGWHAHTLNAPGKFLVSAPEHTTPRRGRAYLINDQAVSETAARYAGERPELDDVSRHALGASSNPAGACHRFRRRGHLVPAQPEPADPPQQTATAEDALWFALCMAPEEGTEVGELIAVTGMSRPTLYRHLAQHAKAGRAVQVSRGRWRAATTEEPHCE